MSRKIRNYSVCFLLAFLALATVFTSTANAETAFSSQDAFAIPDCNSQIRFATGGSYNRATLEDSAWVFDNLNFDAAHNVTGFSVSAKDCNVTVTGISGIDWFDQIGWVTYNVTGVGSQTFRLSSLTGDGGFVDQYAVFIDGVNKTEGDGWTYTSGSVPNYPHIASDYFTVTGAAVNVSIGYTAIFNPAPLEPESASQLPSPTPTASSTPSSAGQPQEQASYTVALVIVVVAVLVTVLVERRLLHSGDDRAR
jgi:hypothetical protein